MTTPDRRKQRSCDPLVALHYLAQFALLVSYPALLMHNLLNGDFWPVLGLHLLAVGGMGLLYQLENRHLPAEQRVSALSFLPMAVIMPVSYALFTPLALLTLDSGSWETRGGVGTSSLPVQHPQPEAAPEGNPPPPQALGSLSP